MAKPKKNTSYKQMSYDELSALHAEVTSALSNKIITERHAMDSHLAKLNRSRSPALDANVSALTRKTRAAKKTAKSKAVKKRFVKAKKATKKVAKKSAKKAFKKTAKSAKTRAPKTGKAVKSTVKSAAKYRNTKDKTQTWAGRGKRPVWLSDAIKAGRPIESFAV